MEDETSESRNHSRLAIMELTNMISTPMCLHAVIRLNVPDAIWQGGSNTPLSASQILARVLPTGDPQNLERILRVLTAHGVFAEHLEAGSSPAQIIRKYSLTDVGKTLVTDAAGLSHAAYALQHFQEEMMKTWSTMHEAVADSATEPFAKVNGEGAYTYYGKKPEMNGLMQRAMSGVSVPFMKAILQRYNGFDGVQRLVDVGGSGGDCLKMILQKHTTIKEGINFDLPDVVAKAPVILGVTHVGGDMFESVPNADAIFMKWVLTSFTDEECKVIMKNCNKALPESGKMIVCEPVVPVETDNSLRTRALLEADIFIMTIYRARGKYRTEEEYRQLGHAAGFPHLKVSYIDHFFTVLEFQK